MTEEFHDDINTHLEEIETLKTGLLNNLNTITTGNFAHRVCFSKYLASSIGVECERLRSKVQKHTKELNV